MKRKIQSYRREASYYDKSEDRNGTELVEPAENAEATDGDGNMIKRRNKIRRRKAEGNGVSETEGEDDEGKRRGVNNSV